MSSTLLNKDQRIRRHCCVNTFECAKEEEKSSRKAVKTSLSYECSNTNGDAVAPAPSNVTRALAERQSNTRSKISTPAKLLETRHHQQLKTNKLRQRNLSR